MEMYLIAKLMVMTTMVQAATLQRRPGTRSDLPIHVEAPAELDTCHGADAQLHAAAADVYLLTLTDQRQGREYERSCRLPIASLTRSAAGPHCMNVSLPSYPARVGPDAAQLEGAAVQD